MRTRYALALLLLGVPTLSWAQDTPEQLLSGKTQIYLRWDGLDAHKEAYAKTALGKMMKGDTGTFVNSVFGQIQEGLNTVLTVEQLLGGVAPEKLKAMQDQAAEAAKLPAMLSKHGFLFAAEVSSLEPPAGQITIIVPGAGDQPNPLFGALRLAAGLSRAEVKEKKLDKGTLYCIDMGFLSLSWWAEGKHVVLAFSTDKPEAVVKKMTAGNHVRLAGNALYKRVSAFKEFGTSARAFVDVASLVQLGGSRSKEVKGVLDDMGMDGLKALVFYSGFDGDAERGLVEWDMPSPRKGIVSLLTGKPFTLKDLPPLPPDVISWSMTNFDTPAIYDVTLQMVEKITGLVEPDAVAAVKDFPKQANAFLGVDLRKDLLGSLGDKMVLYVTPSEGPLQLGQTVLVKVKDEKKLRDSIDLLIKSLARLTGAEINVKKKTYRGVELREIHVAAQGFIFVPTYAIHKDWLAFSFYPQPVQGYILRSTGEVKSWEPSAKVKEMLEKMPREMIAVTYSDPRPSIKQLLSIAPLIGAAVNSFNPEAKFDVGSLPNAQEATEHLFPNVTVTSDDGKTLRVDTRASIQLPFDIAGIDAYAFFLLFGFASLRAF